MTSWAAPSHRSVLVAFLLIFLSADHTATAASNGSAAGIAPPPRGPSALLAQRQPGADELTAYRGVHAAAANGDGAEIRRLAAAGADIDATDHHGRTPLMVAAYQRNREAAEALIEAGADVNVLDSERYDLLTIAAVLDDVWMVNLASASGAEPTLVTSPYDGTALIAAAHLGHVEIVRALIAAEAPLDHVNNLGWTALIEAIVLGDGGPRHVAIVEALVEAGANIDLPDAKGTRPLRLAQQRNHRDIARILERAGAQP
jgi:ankyrin repeat protein